MDAEFLLMYGTSVLFFLQSGSRQYTILTIDYGRSKSIVLHGTNQRKSY